MVVAWRFLWTSRHGCSELWTLPSRHGRHLGCWRCSDSSLRLAMLLAVAPLQQPVPEVPEPVMAQQQLSSAPSGMEKHLPGWWLHRYIDPAVDWELQLQKLPLLLPRSLRPPRSLPDQLVSHDVLSLGTTKHVPLARSCPRLLPKNSATRHPALLSCSSCQLVDEQPLAKLSELCHLEILRLRKYLVIFLV